MDPYTLNPEPLFHVGGEKGARKDSQTRCVNDMVQGSGFGLRLATVDGGNYPPKTSLDAPEVP